MAGSCFAFRQSKRSRVTWNSGGHRHTLTQTCPYREVWIFIRAHFFIVSFYCENTPDWSDIEWGRRKIVYKWRCSNKTRETFECTIHNNNNNIFSLHFLWAYRKFATQNAVINVRVRLWLQRGRVGERETETEREKDCASDSSPWNSELVQIIICVNVAEMVRTSVTICEFWKFWIRRSFNAEVWSNFDAHKIVLAGDILMWIVGNSWPMFAQVKIERV